jgi:hypothetical protein
LIFFQSCQSTSYQCVLFIVFCVVL